VVREVAYEGPEGHAERLLPAVEQLLAATGVSRSQIDRLAVGVGPGSFTGIRVGVALAQGISLGLGRPVVGVGSLRAMCWGVPAEQAGVRIALLDARKGDVFAAVHGWDGVPLVEPFVLPSGEARAWLDEQWARFGPGTLVGEAAAALGLPGVLRSDSTDGPSAVSVARVGRGLDPESAQPEPAYVREADAIRPNLPPSPLSSERRA
jgi:tRNA threonylcarbamoyladenosine biosynthesis protein TsaB